MNRMWRSLRSRLTISHLLPLLVIVPLLSFLLFYLIEARFVLDEATAELAGQGELISRLYQAELAAQEDPEQASSLFARLRVRIPTLFYLVDQNGNIVVRPGLATASTEVPIRPPDPELLQKALAGEIARQVHMGNADVAVPVRNEEQEVVGAVHLSQQLTDVTNRLAILRWTVWGAVSAGLLVSVFLSFVLSRSLNQPLERLTAASRAVNFDAPPSKVEEEGPAEVRTLARTFNEMSERLHELEQGRRRLLSAVVHELGRPLGAIKAAAQVLGQNDNSSELVVELSSGIDDQVDQLRRLLDDLALLARNDVQNLALDVVPTDVGELVLEECRRYDQRIRQKEIELITRIPQKATQAAADPMRLSQIVGNLLDNAIKYTPNRGQIEIMVGSEADRVVLTFEDTGPGIDPSESERIFDFLYRSPRQERVREGMGIGLALSRRLAEAQGGTLTARQRAVGTGARFVLSLPME
ncbi:MAG: HAMP domain-containing histidine kinase [Caldilineaceae bacterium SB0665_bin_25]|nr:HAMP domain-containing histidine kinase [Caldilineaceae bacterium SB0665_bin_25]